MSFAEGARVCSVEVLEMTEVRLADRAKNGLGGGALGVVGVGVEGAGDAPSLRLNIFPNSLERGVSFKFAGKRGEIYLLRAVCGRSTGCLWCRDGSGTIRGQVRVG